MSVPYAKQALTQHSSQPLNRATPFTKREQRHKFVFTESLSVNGPMKIVGAQNEINNKEAKQISIDTSKFFRNLNQGHNPNELAFHKSE